jgi:hypothetical protein
MTADLEPGAGLPEADAGGGELPDVEVDVGGGDADYTADLAETLAESKGERPAEDEVEGYKDALTETVSEQAEAVATQAAEQAWEPRWNELYKAALEGHGLSEQEAAARGITRESATERLFAADAVLRQDPAQGLAQLATSYAAKLPVGDRANIAAAVLQSLGFESAAGVGEHERAQLAQFHQAQREAAQAWEQTVAGAVTTLERFAARHPDLSEYRTVMGGLMQSGAAGTLDEAYQMAKRARGAPTSGYEAQRQAVEKARNARTPRTASSPVPASEDDDAGLSQRAVLLSEYRRATGSGRR